MADFHRVNVNDDNFIRAPARLLIAGITVAMPTKISDVIDLTVYNAQSGWTDLGGTKTGVTWTINSTDESFDVDQIVGDLKVRPNSWECSIGTQLAEVTLETLQVAWEGSDITTDAATEPDEREMGFGNPTRFTERRLAVLAQKDNDKIRAVFFRKVVRASQESSLAFNKTGEQQSVPVRFRGLPDLSITDVKKRFFIIRDQV